jgi:hypothetical protein
MREVHQHPDGLIYVRTPSVTYSDTPANAALDFGETLPPLPPGSNDRIYVQGVRHAIMATEGGLLEGGPIPWALGDRMIANVEAALALKNTRDHPPLTPAEIAKRDADAAAKVALDSRLVGFESDIDFKDMVSKIKSTDLATIKNFLQGDITTLATAKPWLIKAILLLAYLVQKHSDLK